MAKSSSPKAGKPKKGAKGAKPARDSSKKGARKDKSAGNKLKIFKIRAGKPKDSPRKSQKARKSQKQAKKRINPKIHAHKLKSAKNKRNSERKSIKKSRSRRASKPKMMKIKVRKAFIYFVRHGQAKGNGQNMYNGARVDSPLTPKGRAQANKLAKEWNFSPDFIYSSTLTRAAATARPFAKKHNKPVIYTDLAAEQDYGQYTGVSAKKLADLHAPGIYYDKRRDQTFTPNPPGGESWAKMRNRAEKLLAMLDRKHTGKYVVVFSHSDFINCAYAVRFGLSDAQAFQRGDVPNCGVVRF